MNGNLFVGSVRICVVLVTLDRVRQHALRTVSCRKRECLEDCLLNLRQRAGRAFAIPQVFGTVTKVSVRRRDLTISVDEGNTFCLRFDVWFDWCTSCLQQTGSLFVTWMKSVTEIMHYQCCTLIKTAWW